MLTTKRRLDPGVAERLLAEPHRFQFFQALRVLEHVFARQGERPGEALPRRIRFGNSLSLAFPSSEIEALEAEYEPREADADRGDAPAGEPTAPPSLREVRLVPAFIGLLGVGGTLPLNYTERLAERELYQRDRAARAFLDIFNNRAVALFYQGWKKHRPGLQYEIDGRERFLPQLLSLAGHGLKSLRGRLHRGEGAVYEQSLAHYALLFRQRPVSARFLQRALGDYFGVSLRLEQFAGAWYPVPAEQQTRLGASTAGLGTSALAGERVWQRNLRARLWIGPLEARRFQDFLPGGDAARALARLLGLLTGIGLEYEVRLILRAGDVRPAGLQGDGGARLGFDTFLLSAPADQDRADARYLIQPDL